MNSARYAIAAVGAIILFAIGLELYFLFSAQYGDGLENTVERAGAKEGKPFFKAPLDYGDDYRGGFLAGLLGFAILFLLAYGVGRFVVGKRAR